MKHNFITRKTLDQILTEVINDFLNKDCGLTNKPLVTEMLKTSISPKRLGEWLEKTFNLKSYCNTINYSTIPQNAKTHHELYKFLNCKSLNAKGLSMAPLFNIQFYGEFGNITFEMLQDVIKWLNNHGWYFAYVKLDDANHNSRVHSSFTKKLYDYIIKKGAFCQLSFRNIHGKEETDIPSICYHIAPLIAKYKILKQGLVPKHRDRVEMHPERVYLYSSVPDEWGEITREFKTSEKTEKRKEGYVLLSIDMRELKNKLPLFQDDNLSPFADGIYTTEPIPPKYINVISEIEN